MKDLKKSLLSMLLWVGLGREWRPRIGLTGQVLAAKAQEEALQGEAAQVNLQVVPASVWQIPPAMMKCNSSYHLKSWTDA